jgi:hypothetical protein
MEGQMRSLLTAFVALFLATAAPASAQTDCVAPPGTAAIEQYCETVPSATGAKGGGASAPTTVDGAARSELRSKGPDGRALAQLLASDRRASMSGGDATADGARGLGSDHGDGRPAPRSGRVESPAPPAAPSFNPLDAVSSAVEAGPTLGGPFGWPVLGLTVLMIGAGWLRLPSPSD